MSSFQALMALSASQTKESQSAVQIALRERQKKEAAKRKEQEERDKKEREQEQKIRLKHFEEQKREVERQKREEERLKALEAALKRREDEQRNALLYGPKRSSKYPTSTSGVKESVRKSRLPSDDADDGEPTAGSSLTREELRQKKQMAEQRRLYAPSKRSSGTSSYTRQGKRLPGGAVDITTTAARNSDEGAFKSVKDRLAAQPITLTKLNVIKRDTRTIDEIVQDRAKAKILDGDKAREFSDWFGSSKKKELAKRVSPPTTATSTPLRMTPAASQSATSTIASGANTPLSQRGTPGPNSAYASATVAKKAQAQLPKHAAMSASSKSSFTSIHSASSPTVVTNKFYAQQVPQSRAANGNGKPTKSSLPSSQSSTKSHSSLSAVPKKRPRSESRSESPPSKRRSNYAEEEHEEPENLRSIIWNMFGRNRDTYVGMDVFSDDEDMEADAVAVAREEVRSARLAALEDQKALEEERRHEEEKRRKKKEREARAMSSR